ASNNAGIVYASWPSLATNAGVSLDITVRANVPGTITNTANVSSAAADPTLGNNTTSLPTTVVPAADLGLSQTANPSTLMVSSNMTFTIVLTNRGPSTATGVVVTDPLPPGFNYVSAQASQGVYSQFAGVVTCSINSFASGSSATITITARPTLDGVFANVAS